MRKKELLEKVVFLMDQERSLEHSLSDLTGEYNDLRNKYDELQKVACVNDVNASFAPNLYFIVLNNMKKDKDYIFSTRDKEIISDALGVAYNVATRKEKSHELEII